MIKHFIMIPFSGLGRFDKQRTEEYWNYRVNIFRKFTFKSLLNQSCKNFTLWISFRPQDKEASFVEELTIYLKDSGLDYIFTFDGPIMWDDRGTENNDTLLERTSKTLQELNKRITNEEYIYITGLGSDDMLSQEAIWEIQQETPQTKKALYYTKGFIYDARTEQIADWNRDTPCSKYTIIYPVEVFKDAQKYWDYEFECLKSHEYITKCYQAKELKKDRYCCVVHGANISTDWFHVFRGKEYFNQEDKLKILSKFGIC